MNTCICCHGCLLRHVRHRDICWYCPNCRQDMPTLDIGDRAALLSISSQANRALSVRSGAAGRI